MFLIMHNDGAENFELVAVPAECPADPGCQRVLIAHREAADLLANLRCVILDELHALAGALLEYETLTGEESKKAIAGEDIGRPDPQSRRPAAPSSGGSSIPKTRRPGGGRSRSSRCGRT